MHRPSSRSTALLVPWVLGSAWLLPAQQAHLATVRPLAPPQSTGILPENLAIALPTDPLFDVGPDAVRVFAASYKAGFDRDGLEFAPFLGSDAPRTETVRFRVAAASAGRERLHVATVDPVRQGDRVVYDHGPLRACYEVRREGIEQTFVFDTLPDRGPVAVELIVATTLQRTLDDRGCAFSGERGGVRCSSAFAVDAIGRKIAIPTIATADGLRLVVPESFVQEAQLPLVIDPLIGTVTTLPLNNGGRQTDSVDIAYEATTDRHLVVAQWVWSATDVDCVAFLLDSQLQQVGPAVTIDSSLDAWEWPRVASCNSADNFLVVAQVSANRTSPSWIAGRTVSAVTGAASPQFDIERATLPGHLTGDKLRPDVGGDGNPATPGFYTVVWERVYSATDHDVHMKQVTPAGTLRTTQPTLIDNAGTNETSPAISKSDGNGDRSSQHWAISYQRTAGANNEDIRGAFVTWDGQVRQVRGAGTFPVVATAGNERLPRVSSPTIDENGRRRFLFTWQRDGCGILAAAAGHAAVVELGSGMVVASTTLPDCSGAYPIATDSDGCRFTTMNWRSFVLRLQTWAYTPSAGLVAHDLTDFTRSTTQLYVLGPHPGLTSRYAGGGTGPGHVFATVEANTWRNVFLQQYDAYHTAGGFSSRATACGTEATIGWYGTPALGEEVVVYQYLGVGLRGYVFGTPANVPLSFCTGCTVGVQGSTVMTDPLTISVPCRVELVGTRFSLQGFHFGNGPCLSAISLSDTLDLTIR